MVQAGTATSTRVRDQAQSFNIVDINGDRVTVTVDAWNGDAFAPADAQPYQYRDGRWRILNAQEQAH